MKFLHLRAILLAGLFFLIAMPCFSQKRQGIKKSFPPAIDTGLVKNGIKIHNRGFKLTEAYLVFDDETVVPEGNKVALNQNVNMLLIIDGGWTESGGRVFPGSKQVLSLSNGREITNSEELFAAFDETGVSPEDARYISLNATIMDLKDKMDHIIVNFRLWDKKGTAEMTGSYKLYIR